MTPTACEARPPRSGGEVLHRPGRCEGLDPGLEEEGTGGIRRNPQISKLSQHALSSQNLWKKGPVSELGVEELGPPTVKMLSKWGSPS